MRSSLCICVALALASCARGEPSEVTLELKKPTRVNGCHIYLHHVLLRDPPIADVTFACDVPESALKEKNWWGQGVQRPATELGMGDCLRLGNRFYCTEIMQPGESVTLKATYEILHDRRIDHIRPIR
ncbi:hypothetical protein [Polyangium mundeleinium]|uniref:Lipoprotein n=1 Tax=Polyangium mundeleinium TaxID=2995306 RepID=A0ABT5EL43_9BACT|nr:hypothetical protein [Polyangium mundeleinium]MDC0742565.1 hypothetical protein [Polyangium mundeleinium]